MQDIPRRVLVTGSNKGIGYGILEKALIHSQEDQAIKYHLIMTSRDLVKGKKAIESLKEKFPAAADIELIELDLLSSVSISNAVEALKKSGPIDVLVNNAGWFARFEDQGHEDLIKNFIESPKVNYLATRDFTEAILKEDLINKNGMIINVSSRKGKFSWNTKLDSEYLEKLKNYKNPERLSLDEFTSVGQESIEKLLEKARDPLQKENLQDPYCLAKMLLSMYTYYLGKEPTILSKNIQVYSCHPGLAKTDMNTTPFANISYLEGADNVYHFLLFKPKIDPALQGEYFNELRVVEQLTN